ncbi:MAG: ferredoxin [Candidatus Omnitrophica bacterium]|nr:ferredoxin [Candidatus Omnitrophota bacterium]MCM8793979.1 ferredoxin [Candidatus Omnitrophota bacterium]
MIAKINPDLCIGCELCTQTCPEVFFMEGDKAKVKTNPVPKNAEETCRQAKEDCPVEAIIIEE